MIRIRKVPFCLLGTVQSHVAGNEVVLHTVLPFTTNLTALSVIGPGVVVAVIATMEFPVTVSPLLGLDIETLGDKSPSMGTGEGGGKGAEKIGALAVPVKPTIWGLPGASSNRESWPERVPVTDGEKVTSIVQLAPVATVAGQWEFLR